MSGFEGKVYAITGGASGIGLSLAKLLAKRGAKVSIADVTQAQLQEAETSIKEVGSGEVLSRQCDVRELSQLKAWITDTVNEFGKLDGAANIAGVFGRDHNLIGELDEDNWDFVIAVNLTGVLRSMKAELEVLQPGGSIVNAASIAGLFRGPRNAAYSVSKHGVIGLTKTAAKEYGSKNIRVNAVAPGVISTPMVQSIMDQGPAAAHAVQSTAENAPLGRRADPEEVAKVIAFLLSDDASFVTGSVYMVDAGAMS